MKWYRHLFLFIGLSVFGLLGWLAFYLGAFKPVEISEKTLGPFSMVYLEHRGAYHEISKVIEKVEVWAKKNNVSCTQSFGEYLDNPNNTEEARLRSYGGCILTEPLLNKEMPAGFNVKQIATQKYAVAIFDGSPGIGPLKVYPKVESYLENKKYQRKTSVIEIYEIKDRSRNLMTTTYLFAYE